jgi:hypothetical protein
VIRLGITPLVYGFGESPDVPEPATAVGHTIRPYDPEVHYYFHRSGDGTIIPLEGA